MILRPATKNLPTRKIGRRLLSAIMPARRGGSMPEIRPVTGACVWHGSDMAGSKRWQRQLSPVQLAEIDRALTSARAGGVSWEAMTAEDFPLPSFMPLAAEIRAELEDGCGLLLLRGIEP